ncbi:MULTISPECIES: RICIN domain-containing protein [unclassified Streptosporangium]|uniref:RICIN domain-containing protein n=1 Tax=unclassified Streptosporangium TaxID=2632669 RepID=UPI002E2E50D9|nr:MULTISPECIES: ricin-type beta-trefoil lectin domain protein [unclassified Streptosporangium]
MLGKIIRTALAGLIMATTLSAITTTPAQATAAYRHFKSTWANRCLSVQGGSTSNGAFVVEWGCNTTPEQKWYWSGQNIVNAKSGKCLTSDSLSRAVIWDCHDWEAPEQDWWLSSRGPQGSGEWAVVNYKTGRLLGVSLSGPTRVALYKTEVDPEGSLTTWDIYAVA